MPIIAVKTLPQWFLIVLKAEVLTCILVLLHHYHIEDQCSNTAFCTWKSKQWIKITETPKLDSQTPLRLGLLKNSSLISPSLHTWPLSPLRD